MTEFEEFYDMLVKTEPDHSYFERKGFYDIHLLCRLMWDLDFQRKYVEQPEFKYQFNKELSEKFAKDLMKLDSEDFKQNAETFFAGSSSLSAILVATGMVSLGVGSIIGAVLAIVSNVLPTFKDKSETDRVADEFGQWIDVNIKNNNTFKAKGNWDDATRNVHSQRGFYYSVSLDLLHQKPKWKVFKDNIDMRNWWKRVETHKETIMQLSNIVNTVDEYTFEMYKEQFSQQSKQNNSTIKPGKADLKTTNAKSLIRLLAGIPLLFFLTKKG